MNPSYRRTLVRSIVSDKPIYGVLFSKSVQFFIHIQHYLTAITKIIKIKNFIFIFEKCFILFYLVFANQHNNSKKIIKCLGVYRILLNENDGHIFFSNYKIVFTAYTQI